MFILLVLIELIELCHGYLSISLCLSLYAMLSYRGLLSSGALESQCQSGLLLSYPTKYITTRINQNQHTNTLYTNNIFNTLIRSDFIDIGRTKDIQFFHKDDRLPIPDHVRSREIKALMHIYEDTGGPHWCNNSNWGNTEVPLDRWYGVTLDIRGYVNRHT